MEGIVIESSDDLNLMLGRIFDSARDDTTRRVQKGRWGIEYRGIITDVLQGTDGEGSGWNGSSNICSEMIVCIETRRVICINVHINGSRLRHRGGAIAYQKKGHVQHATRRPRAEGQFAISLSSPALCHAALLNMAETS